VLVRVKTGSKLNPKTGRPYVGVYVQRRLGDPDRTARRDLERTGASDIPEPAAGEFVHPDQASLDDVPFTGEEPAPEGQRNQEARLRRLGCVCEDPVKVELKQSVGDIDCPLPGHAPF
jgi:hypothetical protein